MIACSKRLEIRDIAFGILTKFPLEKSCIIYHLRASRPLEIFKNKGFRFFGSTLEYEWQILSRETECANDAVGRVALSRIPELTADARATWGQSQRRR
jgi:hypothetical protein